LIIAFSRDCCGWSLLLRSRLGRVDLMRAFLGGRPCLISLLASVLMLLESCTGYLTSYQTPCVEGHVCECVQYTTIYRSWLDCRDYGRVKSRAY